MKKKIIDNREENDAPGSVLDLNSPSVMARTARPMAKRATNLIAIMILDFRDEDLDIRLRPEPGLMGWCVSLDE